MTTEVDNPPSPLSAARVATPSSEKHARKMCFRIAKLLINRSWVSCDQSRFCFQIPTKTAYKLHTSFRRQASISQKIGAVRPEVFWRCAPDLGWEISITGAMSHPLIDWLLGRNVNEKSAVYRQNERLFSVRSQFCIS